MNEPVATGTRRERWGWYFYDWANSAFPTSVVTVFLGPYLTSVAKAASTDGYVYPLGIKIAVVALWPYLVSLSVLLQVIVLPVAGALADYGRRKREMLAGLALAGALATVAMYWMTDGRYLFGAGLFLFANVVFGASLAIYNAFLPEIASAEERDATSSAGWSWGYLGGGLLLALQLALFANAPKFGLSEGGAARIALASSGLWWGLFTLVPYATLRNRGASRQPPAGQSHIGAALRQLAATVREIRGLPHTLLFLAAYLIYNDAAQTMITMAAQFGSEELHLNLTTLSSAILLTQFVAVGGSLAFDRLARWIGAKGAVLVSLVIWIGVLIYIFAALSTAAEFYALAATVGFVMGGTQALSRSLFSFLIPKGHEAEYFSVYEISDKGTSWLGPLTVGLALQWTGNFRVAILSLIAFFAVGFLLLWSVNMASAAREAGNEYS